jgi:hypothetical protein
VRTRTKGCGRGMSLGERAKRPILEEAMVQTASQRQRTWIRTRSSSAWSLEGFALLFEMYVCMIPDDRQDLHYTTQERVWNNNNR